MSSRNQAQFRDIFRGHPAGVTLISATVDGHPVGLTASSVSSLSLEPLSVSFSFMKDTGSAGELLRADSILIHFLTQDQADVAAAFASSSGSAASGAASTSLPHTASRFDPAHGWSTAATGEPLLPHCRAVMRARYLSTMRAGQSTLVAAEITDVVEHNPEGEPLLFLGHRFYSMSEGAPLA